MTCSEGEKETLVGMGGEQLEDALSHAPIAFENQLLAEVIVDLLGHHFLVGRQSHVRHRRHLSITRISSINNELKLITRARMYMHL